MKLISFIHQGQATYGAVIGQDQVLHLGAHLGAQLGLEVPDLQSLLAQGLLAQAQALAASEVPTLTLAELELLPVIPNPGKIICVGLNYHDHVRETGRELTESPALFLRVANSQVAHGQAIARPRESHRLDYEGEIAVIIGQGGRRISEAQSWQHIAGYSCYNDSSIRDWQVATTQWTAGKNFWRTGGFGPWMVTADEIAPDQLMTLTTRLNGQVMQQATTAMLIHSIPRLINYISTVMPLEPGDVIVTGTPGGVGNKRNPQVFMKPGDVVDIEIDAVGVLRNTVCDD